MNGVAIVRPFSVNGACTMRAEIIAYMIYLEGPEFPEYVYYVMNIFFT